MPGRTCVVCRRKGERGGFIRFVSIEGVLMPDPKGVLPGRGAYVCASRECLKGSYKKRDAFARALKSNVSMPDEREFFGMLGADLSEEGSRQGP